MGMLSQDSTGKSTKFELLAEALTEHLKANGLTPAHAEAVTASNAPTRAYSNAKMAYGHRWEERFKDLIDVKAAVAAEYLRKLGMSKAERQTVLELIDDVVIALKRTDRALYAAAQAA